MKKIKSAVPAVCTNLVFARQVLGRFEELKKLFRSPSRWTKGAMGRTSEPSSNGVCFSDDRWEGAVCFCLIGGGFKSGLHLPGAQLGLPVEPDETTQVEVFFRPFTKNIHGELLAPIVWNDSSRRTFADVQGLVRDIRNKWARRVRQLEKVAT